MQLVTLTYAILLLQLVISSPLTHALSDPSQTPNQDSNLGPQPERRMTYLLSYPSPPSLALLYFIDAKMSSSFEVVLAYCHRKGTPHWHSKKDVNAVIGKGTVFMLP